MKNIYTIIIIATLVFSTPFSAFANTREGYIEQLLDLNYGPEEYDLELAQVNTSLFFFDSDTRALLLEVSRVNEILKDEIIRKYRAGDFSHPQTNAIVSSQKKFVYYINELFKYISIKEQNSSYKELDDFILKSYKNSRIYYKKVKYLVNRK